MRVLSKSNDDVDDVAG